MKLFIFDVGGVFRDGSLAMHEGFRRGFESAGLAFDFDSGDIWNLRGIGIYNRSPRCIGALLAVARSGQNLRGIINRGDAEEVLTGIVNQHVSSEDSSIIEKIKSRYKEFFNSQDAKKFVRILPRIRESIDLMHTKYKLAIVTNTTRDAFIRDLENSLDLSKFSAVITRNEMNEKKPSPEGILNVIEKLRIPPGESVYVGDCVIDIRTARDAGCKSIALLSGMGMKIHLEREGPDYIFSDIWEMSNHFINKS